MALTSPRKRDCKGGVDEQKREREKHTKITAAEFTE